MSSPRGDEPTRPVQRGVESPRPEGPGYRTVPMNVVAEFETLDQAKQLERVADAQIVTKLREEGFDRSSPSWRALASALAEYGYAVLVAWGVTGVLGRHAAAFGGVSGRRVPPHLRLDEDEAQSLTTEVLVVALERFRSKSLSTWSPSGGASLRTFFIGRCLMELGDVYERWHRLERRPYPVERLVDDGRFGARPDEQAEARMLADELLDRDPFLRAVLELQTAGYTIVEIAEALGTTPPALRTVTHRRRRRLQDGLDG